MTTATQTPAVPAFQRYMAPTVEVLRKADAAMPNEALNHAVAEHMGLSPEVLAVLHDVDTSDQPEAFYRMAWARTYLKKLGLLDNPKRGAWELTEQGRRAERVDPDEVVRHVRSGIDADAVTPEVPDHVAEELLAIYENVRVEERVPIDDALEACYLRFREKFGPEVLRRLDGEQLLKDVHGRGAKDSLVYWLEFKNDGEFPSSFFGSISGGSALKFGIYQSTETGHWMTGHPRSQRRLSTREAVELVRRQRDQLVAGAEILAEVARASAGPDYCALDKRMREAAPDLANTAWGHKYFSLMAPTLLDDYHALDYQRYHLIRLHKLPSDGRYENAELFSGIARQLGLPLTHLSTVLNRRHGSPRSYWRVGAGADGSAKCEWPVMRDGGFLAVGWAEVGSLEGVEHSKAGKDHVRELFEKRLPSKAGVATKRANQLFQLANNAEVGDIVVAMNGVVVLGIGEISGAYYYSADDGPFAHRRPVTWQSVGEWKLPRQEALRAAFRAVRHPGNQLEIERRLATPDTESQVPAKPAARREHAAPEPLKGKLARIQSALQRKGQAILFGPPGTGKTYWAERAIQELAARSWFSSSYAALADAQQAELIDNGAIEQCCFHPAYGYEDFLVGYRPVASDGGRLAFEVTNGIFARLCERAVALPDKQFFLLIDEINRGDIPRIFGELLTVLENDKRGKAVTVPITGKALVVPPNVFVVGTMNTADRSVALLDAALRRRFAFIEMMPDPAVLADANVGGLPLGAWLAELNDRIVRHAGRDARNLQIGHSYLLRGGEPIRDVGRFAEVLHDDIVPLLQEYCYEDFDALERILGNVLVLRDQLRFDDTLFVPSRRADLIAALLTAFAGITATPSAADADADGEEDDDPDSADEDLEEDAV